MSWTRQTTIWCDGDDCHEWVRHDGTVKQARSVAESTGGWDCSSAEDLCKHCKDDPDKDRSDSPNA